MRLEKYLVLCGVLSRKKIKKAILKGCVTINDKIITDDSTDIDIEKDIVKFNGVIPKLKVLKYYVMNKPAGYITAMEDKNFKTVAELLLDFIDKNSTFPVGRLDRDTEGVLLFTNDGELNHTLSYPDKKIKKRYLAHLDRTISLEDIEQLKSGVTLDTGYKTLPCNVEYISDKKIYLEIVEGKYHQVKKMLKAVNNKVIYLKRVQFGKITLGDLKLGEIKEIDKEDII